MTCTHFWRIAPANGPYSKGVCLLCREERDFRNSEDYFGPDQRVAAHTMYSTPGEKLRLAEAYCD